jgi:nucleotide-binding universal stress UspA family protein
LLNSNKVVAAIQQDYSTALAHSKVQQPMRASLEQALTELDDLPNEADAQALLSKRGATKQEHGIPAQVLDKVQERTGISPQEINQLMNQ